MFKHNWAWKKLATDNFSTVWTRNLRNPRDYAPLTFRLLPSELFYVSFGELHESIPRHFSAGVWQTWHKQCKAGNDIIDILTSENTENTPHSSPGCSFSCAFQTWINFARKMAYSASRQCS